MCFKTRCVRTRDFTVLEFFFRFHEIILQVFAQILQAHVIENMITTSERISKRCVVTRCRARCTRRHFHRPLSSAVGTRGQMGRSSLDFGSSGWAEGPEYAHHIFGPSYGPAVSRAHTERRIRAAY